MYERTAEQKQNYFEELARNLQRERFTVHPEENGCLPVDQDSQPLCIVTDAGGVRYWKDDIAGDKRCEALDRVINIARITAEYMSQMEAAPQLTASSLKGDYRLLADFNDVVLASHPTKYGVQFVTWARIQEGTALDQGHYYGPSVGKDSYTAAKQDFAVRSGLIPRSALFTPEQLTEVYRCIQETLENSYPSTDERQKCLQSTAAQIEHSVPDLDERVTLSNQKELESALEDSGMHFC